MPILGSIYRHLISGHDIITYAAFALVPLTYWALYSTRFGLRLRAVGENPAAVDTAGISVRGLRYSAVIICGVLVGLSGVYLSLAQAAYFQPHMSAGKGFIALAALVFAKWRPWPALATCLLFGFLDALATRLQGVELPAIGAVPVQAIQALPYVLTVVLLAGFIGKAIPPKASGDSLCQRALNRSPRPCLRRPGRRRPRPMRPIRASRSAPRSRTPGGAIFSGCNVENAAYPARRLRRDERDLRHGAGGRAAHRRNPASSATAMGSARPAAAAGSGFANSPTPGPSIHVAGPEGVRKTFTLADLLPESFGPGHLPA